ncbi:SdpI family protein [Acidipila rosea]|uniref:SdpI/YhfL family protein n=1 Tax=Acidipila rosea TaxID=768535 RepID=A0A4R1L7B8_9BACT|nr:SdpI/YhfL family protein [Acidipila rosea]
MLLSQCIFIAVGILLIVLSAPLILRKVPRNDLYGLRIPKTMQGSEQEWYEANHNAGVGICIVGALTVLSALIILFRSHSVFLGVIISTTVLLCFLLAEVYRSHRRHKKD